jgi:hypothetical protein
MKKLNITRKAIMIGSPGQKNTELYLKGVDADLHHFISFLKSPIGGSWEDNETAGLFKCPLVNLIELFQSTITDYLLVYFSGHGHHTLKDTYIKINDSESLSISELISIIRAPKALIIIDSKSKSLDKEYSNLSSSDYLTFKSTYSKTNTSEKYKKIISECPDSIVIAYSCSVGEISNDTELGGLYTYSLLKTTLQWHEYQTENNVLSFTEANYLSNQYLKNISQIEQSSQIRKTNNSDKEVNLPFAINLCSH